ncbi:unnamed protein product [Candida verbasci]|uniref:YMC020W-like alpha/beta hydrolase domain-containing protein n=1 Tax=Candida verbasci TaxID=1227364 RepID=A0A9W4TZ94_9ASCO|nr:unnamed protein product [Candida verbasci]
MSKESQPLLSYLWSQQSKYTTDQEGGNIEEIRELQQGQTSTTENDSTSWLNWFWFTSTTTTMQPEDDDELSNDNKLFKELKLKIQKDTKLSYAIKSSIHNCELSVFDTPSENAPVIYTPKKKIKSNLQIVENQIRKKNDKGTIYPKFEENYRFLTWSSLLRILSKDLICGLKTEHHLYKKQFSKKGKFYVVIIAIHNYLPIKFTRVNIQKSNGNSRVLINKAKEAIHQYFQNQDIQLNIETIELEGMNKIEDSVEEYYKFLMNWKEIIKNSDWLFMCTIANSTPIGINLLAKLVESIHLKKVSLLNIDAYIGPNSDIESKLINRAYSQYENEIIRQIFEYNKANSDLSITLNQSMKKLIDSNVKIIFTGNVNDSFVPLYNQLGMKYDHPNIYRNFISQDSNFITTLFDIILILRNLGLETDYNLISNLSNFEENVEIYEIEDVYKEAIEFSLESTNLIHKRELQINETKMNDFDLNLLPWNLRSLIHELLKYKHVKKFNLLIQLIKDLKNWQPTTNKFKDVKYSFEGLIDVDLNELI